MSLPAKCGTDCRSCRFYISCGGCHDGCGAGDCNRNCRLCVYLCPSRPGAVGLLNSLGGPGFPGLKGQPVSWPGDLPAVLPAIAARFSSMPAPSLLPWVAANAARIVISRDYETGGLRRKTGSVREFARVHPGTRMALHFYVPDPPLEAFWRTRREIYPALKEFDLVTAPNFSVYEDSPRLEHLVNMKRSALVYAEILDRGIRAVPDVSWLNGTDLDRWAEYICRYNIPVISTSIQTVGKNAGHFWRQYLEGIIYLCGRIPEETVVILTGAGNSEKMAAIQSALPQKVVFLTTQPFLLARKGRVIEGVKGRKKASGKRDYDRLFLENAKALEMSIGHA